MTWQYSHGAVHTNKLSQSESLSCGLLYVILSKDQAASYQDSKEYLVMEMFPIFLNILSLGKGSLYCRSTETISLISLLALQIWDFLGPRRFTYKSHYAN